MPEGDDAQFININTARFDARKHRDLPVIGDALEALNASDAARGDWRDTPAGMVQTLYVDWNAMVKVVTASRSS